MFSFTVKEQTNACSTSIFTFSPELTGTGEHTATLDAAQEKFDQNINHTIYVVANHTATIPAAGLSLPN